MEPYVDGFAETPAGFVPRVRTKLLASDWLGVAGARIGFTRDNYKVVPGLYCVGNPTPDSPVLVTCNYKLTFDAVRIELADIDAWILVADTRGINVWCAAGKELFGTHEIILSVNAARLSEVVSHREMILPQLGATGVAAHKVKKGCGFKVLYGPIRAKDLPDYLAAGNVADEAMRMVDFPLRDRAVLIPVEIFLLWKLLAWTILASFLLSGIGPDFFSLTTAWNRGLAAVTTTVFGILAGAALVPLLLNQLPYREFWPKGIITGVAAGILSALIFSQGWLPSICMVLWATAVSSYLAMNFTGSTPYTSPSGVEAEMKRGIPIQAGFALIAIIGWLAIPFFN